MAKKTKYPFRILKLKNCHECPHIDSDRTPGSGYAMDYFCKLQPIPGERNWDWRSDKYNPHGYEIINGYVEWDSEKRKDGDFPEKCPLKKASK